jgi:hypothetical protein
VIVSVNQKHSIITRGLNRNKDKQHIITQGYVSFFKRVIEAVVKIFIPRGNGAKDQRREFEDVVIWAKLVSVNDTPPSRKIEGFIKVRVDKTAQFAVSLTEHVTTTVKQLWNDIVISVRRVRGGK